MHYLASRRCNRHHLARWSFAEFPLGDKLTGAGRRPTVRYSRRRSTASVRAADSWRSCPARAGGRRGKSADILAWSTQSHLINLLDIDGYTQINFSNLIDKLVEQNIIMYFEKWSIFDTYVIWKNMKIFEYILY